VTHAEVVRPFVEKVTAELLGIEKLQVMGDGTIPVRMGSASFFLRLLGENDPILQVYAPVLTEVKRTPELLEKLNELNSGSTFVRAFWVDDQVMIATELIADTLDKEELQNAIDVVSDMANSIDDDLLKSFGGQVQFKEEPESTGGPPQEDTPGYM
jgi:type III secretion system-like peptide-binding chaperone